MTTSGSGLQLPDICAPALPRLLAEHGERLPAETVLRCLAICHDELHHAGVRAGLNHAAEAMARTRLRRPPNPLRTRLRRPPNPLRTRATERT